MLYFRDKIRAETWEQEHSQPGSYYYTKYLRVFVEEMYIIRCGEQKSFQVWSERRRRGAKNSKSKGVVMTSDRNSEAR